MSSDATSPPPLIPVHYPAYPPSERAGCLRFAVTMVLFGSLMLNCLLFMVLGSLGQNVDPNAIEEQFFSGNEDAEDKVAVVRVDGVLMEGMIDFALRQIDHAGKDPEVKAVVLRIDSPGGTITASDALHRRLVEMRDGMSPRYKSSTKPLVTSMGSVAASGGYYIGMPGSPIFAEPTTITGSVGVYAAFPNLAEFAREHGIKMELIKAGGIKASGSLFHEMTPQERQPWQDMVDDAYDQFLTIVTAGRPKLAKKEDWTKSLFEREIPLRDDKGNIVMDWFTGKPRQVRYSRYRADGGTFPANAALEYGLIDQIGDLPEAVDAAAKKAGLETYRAVTYHRPRTFVDSLIGAQVQAKSPLDLERLTIMASPRLWYLAPQAELAGLFAVK